MTGRSRAWLALWTALVAAACGSDTAEWSYPTPVLDLPDGFRVVDRPSPRGPVAFPDRAVAVSVAWDLNRGGDVSRIALTRHPGSTRPEEVWSALNSLRSGNRSWTLEGPETRQVGGRPAWEWTATVPSPQGTVWAVQRTLVVGFPDSTWVASFWGQHPEWQDAERQDQVLSSFRIPTPPRPTPKHPLIALAALILGAAIVWLRTRSRTRPEPARPLPSRAPVVSSPSPPGMPTARTYEPVETSGR